MTQEDITTNYKRMYTKKTQKQTNDHTYFYVDHVGS